MKKKIWNLYAPIYEKAMRADRKCYKFMYHRVKSQIVGKEVLEIATGPGLLAKHVAPAAKRMIATDYSEGMIKEAKKGRYPENQHKQKELAANVALVRHFRVHAKHLPYKDDSFDVVIIANALHVMFEPEKAVKEIERVLRKDGLLIAPNFVSHNKGIISRIWSNILKLAGIKFEHQWSGKEYIIWLKKNGWKILHNKLLPARISLMYVECIKRADA